MKATAFLNGIFLRNNLRAPDETRDKCIEKLETAKNIVELYKHWGKRMHGVKESKALVETVKYLGSDGIKYYEKAGIDFWNCMRATDDNKVFSKETRYELTPYDINFDFDLGTLLGDDKFARKYLKIMKNLRTVLKKKHGYFLTGGLEFGKLINLTSENGPS